MTRRDPEPHWHHPGRAAARRKAWLAAALMVALASLLLAGCFQEPPPTVAVETVTTDMTGFTRADVVVTAPSHWVIEALPTDPTLAGAVSFAPSNGSGSAVVTVIVDPAAMPRFPARFRVRLTATHRGKQYVATSREVTFAYPDVSGIVVGGPGGSALAAPDQTALATLAAPGRAAASAIGAHDRLDAHLAPELLAAPTTTLIVGLERPGVVLRANGSESVDGVGGAATFAGREVAVRAALADLGVEAATEPFEAAGLTLVTVPTGSAVRAAAALQGTAGVGFVEFPRLLEPASVDPLRAEQWNLDELGVEALWGVAGGAGVTVAVLDQGFLPTHPDLAANVVATYDAAAGGGPVGAPGAVCGTHGTHVAGIAAAVANNGVGVAGVAPYARLLLVNLGEAVGPACSMTTASLVRALRYVVNEGSPRAQVVNMSIGAAFDLGQGVRDALRAADELGVSLVAAAGNDEFACPAPTTNPIFYPAAYPEVLAVAATEPGGLRACYSHLGPQMFIAAPGGSRTEGVLSTVVTYPGPVAGYGRLQGTSMAAPAVAGVIAMLRSAAPTAGKAAIEQALSATAIDRGAPGRDPEYGFGFVDAAGAYDHLMGPPPPPEPSDDLILRVAGYPDAILDADGLFTLTDALPGPLTVQAGTDPNGNGVLGESGEWFGEATIEVRFGAYAPDAGNAVTVTVAKVP